MTIIDVTQPICDYDGKPLEDATHICQACGQNVEGVVLTLRLVCTSAAVFLATGPSGEPPLPGNDSVKRFALGMRIYENDKPDLTAEEISLLKERIAKQRPPLITARAWGLLDPPGQEPESDD